MNVTLIPSKEARREVQAMTSHYRTDKTVKYNLDHDAELVYNKISDVWAVRHGESWQYFDFRWQATEAYLELIAE